METAQKIVDAIEARHAQLMQQLTEVHPASIHAEHINTRILEVEKILLTIDTMC
jgi:hypothetical protein